MDKHAMVSKTHYVNKFIQNTENFKAVKIDNFHMKKIMLFFMPPTLKKWGAYWFRLVRASVKKKFKLGF